MVDLSDGFQRRLWERALEKCRNAAINGGLNDTEIRFVLQMDEEYSANGFLFEPTKKQFNWLSQIAFEAEKAGLHHGR